MLLPPRPSLLLLDERDLLALEQPEGGEDEQAGKLDAQHDSNSRPGRSSGKWSARTPSGTATISVPRTG